MDNSNKDLDELLEEFGDVKAAMKELQQNNETFICTELGCSTLGCVSGTCSY